MPADLLARCAEVKTRAERRSQAERLQEDAARHARAGRTFAETTGEARSLSAMIAAHRDAGIQVTQHHDAPVQLRSIATRVCERAPEARGSAVEDLAIAIDRDFRAVEAHTTAGFKVGCAQWLAGQPRPNAAFLAALRPSAPGEVAATEAALNEFERVADHGVHRPADVRSLAEAASVLRESYSALATRAPDAVRNFLEQAPHGVLLSELGTDVITWLRANGADDAFTVGLRST